MRILIAEDEVELAKGLKFLLEKNKFTVDIVHDGADALDCFQCVEYDVIVLDIMMPKKDGVAVLKALRKKNHTLPVILLTARDSIADRVNGLDSGADDYLVKPFDFDELLARIRAITRKHSPHASSIMSVGDLTLDTRSHKVQREGKVIELSSKEYAILEYMCMNLGMVLSREKIAEHIWGYDYTGGSNIVDVYISYLRKKIDGGYSKKLLHTIWGSGWMIKENL